MLKYSTIKQELELLLRSRILPAVVLFIKALGRSIFYTSDRLNSRSNLLERALR